MLFDKAMAERAWTQNSCTKVIFLVCSRLGRRPPSPPWRRASPGSLERETGIATTAETPPQLRTEQPRRATCAGPLAGRRSWRGRPGNRSARLLPGPRSAHFAPRGCAGPGQSPGWTRGGPWSPPGHEATAPGADRGPAASSARPPRESARRLRSCRARRPPAAWGSPRATPASARTRSAHQCGRRPKRRRRSPRAEVHPEGPSTSTPGLPSEPLRSAQPR
mmetsp:Transcript_90580/g.286986  ORF Transcript_90580/g.286986 Transcript_90580/m.286986 type:complete len:221 (+) Transcript_90580:282-944(+)